MLYIFETANFLHLQSRCLSDKAPVSTTPFPEFDSRFKTHDELYQYSLDQPDSFWGTLARSRLDWFEDFGQVKDCDMKKGHIRWFLDGKINVSGDT